MTRTTTGSHTPRGLAIMGIAILALITIATGALAQSPAPGVSPAPVVGSPPSTAGSPQSSAAPEAGRRMVVCPHIGWGDGWRLDGGQRRGRDRLRGRLDWDRLRELFGLERMRGRDMRQGPDVRPRAGIPPRRRPPIAAPRLSQAASRVATISAIDGTTVTLVTTDGWSRTVDTTGIPITRGGDAVSVGELRVGDRLQVGQRRSDDGTWQVTRLRVALATVRGTVSALTGNGFEVTTQDGETVAVRVSETTTWMLGCRRGLTAPLEVGSQVVAQGLIADDGSLDATVVAASRAARRPPWRAHRVPGPASTPAPVGSPAA